MQIRILFLIVLAAMTGVSVGLGRWNLARAVSEYRVADASETAADTGRVLFQVGDDITAERTATSAALLADAPADPATRAALVNLRFSTDQSVDEAEQQIDGESYPGTVAQMDALHATRDELAGLRVKADTMVARPRSKRDPAFFRRFLSGVNTVAEPFDTATDLIGLTATPDNGATGDLLLVSRLAWMVRRQIVAQSTPLLLAIDAASPLTPAQLEEQAGFEASLQSTWSLIAAASRRLDAGNAAIDAARGAFNEYDRLCQSLVQAGRASGRYTVIAARLNDKLSDVATSLKQVRDGLLQTAHERALASRIRAAEEASFASGGILLTGSLGFLVLVLLQMLVMGPLGALTRALRHMSQREYNVWLPALGRGGEIGRMSAAVEVLRKSGEAIEQSKARMVHMARHDALTGLPNRQLLRERMAQALTLVGRGQICAVLCLDLDRFKAVNDTFGHPVGDLLLRSVAERLTACVRETDTVTRLGGDEFVVLLVGIDMPDDAGVLASRIVRTLCQPFDLEGTVVGIGASVGISLAPQDGDSDEVLMKNADVALYRAKSEGKGTWRYFEAEMNAKLQARLQLENDLREAIGTPAFEVAYQPVYTLSDGGICGFEALVRWQHPERGPVSPAEFIPLAEETGLVTKIGAFVLRRACQEATAWPDTVRLAVNLSATQFKRQDVLGPVRDALAASGLAPRRLELEITEAALLKNTSETLTMLQALREMGVRISMDDFGTGYASISQLRSFPFDNIKIDDSFVREMLTDDGAHATVRAIIALGISFGMTTNAEGVETEAQLAELRALGCTKAQGYLFSRAVSAGEARSLVRQRKVTATAGV